MSTAERDFGYEAQQAAEAHLAACWDAMYAYENDEVPPEGIVDPASAPFCGCTTCVTREILWAAWNVIDAYVDDALGEQK